MDFALETALRAGEPVLWANPRRRSVAAFGPEAVAWQVEIAAAAARLDRFGPLLAECFPELAACDGRIESALLPAPRLGEGLLVKADHVLPVAGSVKARGGVHAVLVVAERLAWQAGIIDGLGDDYRRLGSPAARELFAGHTLCVGSTGNLGLSIGIMGRALGFAVTVHMAAAAKEWKKTQLRELGATVVEYAGDYTAACAAARREAQDSPSLHFIDDENSPELFCGYAVAGLRLPAQLAALGIPVSDEHPLSLYLPCGVGGAPGGIALGARLALGDAVHIFFAEPTQAPCMLLGLASGRHADIGVADIGLSGRTVADGLAVGRPSRFVGRLMEPVIDGAYTVADEALLRLVAAAWREGGLRLEPSATAGLAGPEALRCAALPLWAEGPVTHIAWATGGGMVPETEFAALVAAGEAV